MTENKLAEIIQACKRGDEASQKKLFMEMYDYGMAIASRYAKTLPEAEEIANNGFLKMLNKIQLYKESTPFKLWLRRIIINCGIDYFRKYHKKQKLELQQSKNSQNKGAENLDSEYLLQCIRRLSPAYRMAFVLFAVEGFSHKEIAEKLGISIGTSKSNLSKARKSLQKMIHVYDQ